MTHKIVNKKKRKRTIIERRIIRTLRHKVIKQIKNINIIRHEIASIKALKPTSPILLKSNHKKIAQYNIMMKKNRDKIIHLKKTIRKLKYQVDSPIMPKKKHFRRLTKIEDKIVKKMAKKSSNFVKIIRKSKYAIGKLELELKKLPKTHPKDMSAKKTAIYKRILNLKKVVKHVTKKYKTLNVTIKRMAPQTHIRSIVPHKLKLKYMHKMFRCKLIPGPMLQGPFPGPGKSKK